jgi:hypothetical protein
MDYDLEWFVCMKVTEYGKCLRNILDEDDELVCRVMAKFMYWLDMKELVMPPRQRSE